MYLCSRMKYEDFYKFVESKVPGSKILFVSLTGSYAYGTNTDKSDKDYRGVYIQPLNDILSFNYKGQINDNKNDVIFYEIKRFFELLIQSNPNILELLNVPDDCVIYKHSIFDTILSERDKFIIFY